MASSKSLRVLEVMKTQSLRWQLYVMITIMTTLQLCGINAVECLFTTDLASGGFLQSSGMMEFNSLLQIQAGVYGTEEPNQERKLKSSSKTLLELP